MVLILILVLSSSALLGCFGLKVFVLGHGHDLWFIWYSVVRAYRGLIEIGFQMTCFLNYIAVVI